MKGQNYRIYTGIDEDVYCGPYEDNNPIFKINGVVAVRIPWTAIGQLELPEWNCNLIHE